jgi:hypothetical protein
VILDDEREGAQNLYDRPSADGAQGQRPLNRCASKDFQQVVFVPTTATAFHGDARAVGMLLQE